MTGNRGVAQECAQETFVRALEQLQRGRTVNAQWLYKVARNRTVDEFRRRRRFRLNGEDGELESRDHGPDERMAINEALSSLSIDDRTILYLTAIEGRSSQEIAEVTGIRVTAVRMRLSRARERFRAAYGGQS